MIQHQISSTLVRIARVGFFVAAAAAIGARASAQTIITLPDTTQTTTLTATVADQARVTVPAGVAFTVNDIATSTTSGAASVTVSNIVVATALKQLRLSLQAEAAAFTPPVGGATTWSATDVSWNAAVWTNAAGATGTLSNTAYNPVATCTADASSCSTAGLTFTLASKSTVKRSGNHTLVIRWKFESI
jgi:hypothetical protein